MWWGLVHRRDWHRMHRVRVSSRRNRVLAKKIDVNPRERFSLLYLHPTTMAR